MKKCLQTVISFIVIAVVSIPFTAFAGELWYAADVYGYDETIYTHAKSLSVSTSGYSGGAWFADDSGNLTAVYHTFSGSTFAKGGFDSATYQDHPYYYLYNINHSMYYATADASADSFGDFQKLSKCCIVIGDGYIKEHLSDVIAAISANDSTATVANSYSFMYVGSIMIYSFTTDYQSSTGEFRADSLGSLANWMLTNKPWGSYDSGSSDSGNQDLSGLRQAVVELQRKVKQIEATVSSLQDSVSALQAEYTSISSMMSDIQLVLDSINQKITYLKQDMNAGFTDVNNNIVGATNQIIKTLEDMTNNLTAQFTRVVNAVIYGNEEGTRDNLELQNDLEQFSGELDGINGNISSASGYIDSAGADAADYIKNFSLFYEYTSALNGVGAVLTLGIVFIFVMKLIGR